MKRGTHSIRNRLISMLLCAVMIAGMLPVLTSAAQADNRIVDPSTTDSWKNFFGPDKMSTEFAGGVWTDKSVFKDNSEFASAGVTMTDPEKNFLVALSALASTKKITGYASLPTDTMLVLDVSGSVGSANATAMVNATNAAIHELMALSKYNRVGVVLYSGNQNFGDSNTSTGIVLLPLDHYTTTETTTFTMGSGNNATRKTVGRYLNISSGNTPSVSVNSTVRNGNNQRVSGSKSVAGGTYIQNGLYKAWQEFERVSEDGTVIAADSIQGGTQRIPIVVLMSDGEPTTGTDSYNNVGTSHRGNGSECNNQIAFVTQLTAAWINGKISAAYNNTDPLFYTLGLGTESSSYATSILNPSSMGRTSTLRTYWNNFLNNTPDRNNQVTVSGSGNNAWRLEKDSAVTSYAYADRYWLADDAADLVAAFDDIVQQITIQTEYYPTLITSGEREIDGYITFEDDLGEFMEVKDIKGIVIGDVLFSGEEMANALNTGVLGTPSSPSDLGNEFVWTVMERLGIDEVSVAQQLIDAAYNAGQLSTSATGYSNYIGWYADANGNYLAPWNDSHTEEDYPKAGNVYSADAAYINRSYGYLGKTGVGNIGTTDMMHIVVKVQTEIATNRQLVSFSIPAALIPMVIYHVELNGDTYAPGQTGKLTYEAADPIQLVFEVGLRSDINAVNVAQVVGSSDHYHFNAATGEYEFYTNRWGSINGSNAGFDYTDPFSHLVAVSDFRPSLENERYYYTEDAAIYTDTNGNKYTGTAMPTDKDPASSSSGYYHLRYIVETTNGSNAVVKALYEPIHDDSLADAVLKDGSYVIPKGTVLKLIDQFNIPKDGNTTSTLEYAHHPYVTGDQTANYTAYTFLGNNGKLSLKPAAGIALRKEVTEVIDGVSEFTFTVTDVPADYQITDANGNDLTGITSSYSGTTLTLTIPADLTVYITGLEQGQAYTVTESTGNYKVTDVVVAGVSKGTSNTATVTIPPAALTSLVSPIVPVTFTNAPRGYGSLIVSKDVNYPEGFAPGNAHNSKDFTITVAFNGDITGMSAPTDATLSGTTYTLTLKDGDSAMFANIPEGTTYTVTESSLPAGYTLDRVQYSDSNHTIQAGDVDQAHVVNDYTLRSVSPNVVVNGTKTVTTNDANWPAGAAFTLRLWEVIDFSSGTVIDTQLTDTVTEADPDYEIDMSSIPFDKAGTYYFRVIEDVPAEAERIEDMAYDRTYGLFSITVGDTDADGSLEIQAVNAYQNTGITGDAASGWVIEKDFTNVISTDRVYLDIEKTVVDAADPTVEYTDHLADITFGLFQAMTPSATPVYYMLTDGSGQAQIMIPVSKEDLDNAPNNKLVYFLREIAPAVDNRVVGMHYDESWIYAIEITWNETANQAVVRYAPITDGAIGEYTAYTEGFALEHTNTYEKNISTTIDLSGTKTLNGGNDLGGREFSFSLYNATAAFVIRGDAIKTVKNSGNAISFADISFDAPGLHYLVVKEDATSLGGVTIDTTEYHITVLVEKFADTDGTTRLRVANGYPKVVKYGTTANVGNNGLSFDNTYTVTSIPFAITGNKVLTGNKLLEKDLFTFELYEDGDWIGKTTNNANGGFAFAAISYDKAGTYTYTVKEVKGSLGGVTYDETEYTVTVTVTDNNDGTLSAAATYSAGNEAKGSLVFNNSYKAAKGSATISGTKTLNGRTGLALGNEEFTFDLYESNADFSVFGDKKASAQNDTEGNFSITLEYEDPGRRYYILKENTDDEAAGMHYSTLEYHITVSVNDPGTGTLQTTVTVTAPGLSGTIHSNSLRFTNSYKGLPTAVKLDGTKIVKDKLTGIESKPADGAFTFELYSAIPGTTAGSYVKDGDALQTKKNDADGKFLFEEIPLADAGTYYFIVVEYNDSQYDIAYDTTEYLVAVTVEDNWLGLLEVKKITVTGGDYETVHFVNVYDPTLNEKTGQVVIDVTKYLDKKGYTHVLLGRDGYTFKILGDNGYNDTCVSNQDGKASFTLEFTEDDIGKTYTYEITEVLGNKDDIIYSAQKYTVTVTVGVDGTALTTEVKVDGQATTAPAVSFTNTYDPTLTEKEVEVDVDVTKELVNSYAAQIGKDGFKFQLVNKADSQDIVTVTSNAQGKASFTKKYTEADIGKTFTYEISEINTGIGDIDYSDKTYTLTVTIGLSTAGQLSATVKLNGSETTSPAVTFTNTYDPTNTAKEQDVTVDVTKILNNKTATAAALSGFKFQLVDTGSNASATAETDKNGKASFQLTFTQQHIGNTYTYQLTEVNTGIAGMTYDETVYTFTVTVNVDAEGELSAALTVNGQAAQKLEASFTNTYDGPPAPPATGDNAQLTSWVLLMILSAAAVTVLLVLGKRKHLI